MNSDTLFIIIIIACVIMSAYFSATETAFSSLNRIRVKNMADKGNKKAKLVLKLSEDYNSLLSTILIGNNIVNTGCASLATVLFVKYLGGEAGPGVSTLVMTIIVLIFGEVSPKSIAKEMPEAFAMFSAPILNVLKITLTPFNYLFGLWKKLLGKLIKSNDDRSITEEELLTIVEEAEEEGGIDEQESELIRSAIEFSELEAVDILTPRVDVVGVAVGTSKDEVARIFEETGYSRLPIYEDSIDHVLGIISQKDFHNQVHHTDKELTDIIRPVVFVSRNKKIDKLLKELQQKKSHMAVIVDEFGGTNGIVTLEDILEELVGDIWDEHDEVIQEIVQISEKEYMVLGNANLDKLLELVDKEIETEVVTVSGWVMNMLGSIPEIGDCFTYENLEIFVVEMDGKRVEKVRMIVNEQEDEEEE